MKALYKEKNLECARKIADWICAVQYPATHFSSNAGTYPWVIEGNGSEFQANNWNLAFAVMGLLGAHETFKDGKYENAVFNMARYMKSLQIFDPFKKEHYGAIREITSQTPWCYTRDALSCAWGFLVLYEYTKDAEYLQRAELWAEWYFRKGLDEEGWPLWGVQFEPYFLNQEPQMCNDTMGSFQGGGLNFLYHLARVSGNKKWTGKEFVNMADLLVKYIQQENGFFATIERSTKKPPQNDPQSGLHKTNDDLNSLGLLCAYKATNDKKYLDGVSKYLNAVFDGQKEHGAFEDHSVASIPVVLNILMESEKLVNVNFKYENAVERALDKLYSRQSNGYVNPRTAGAIEEILSQNMICARSSCYALIYLVKSASGLKKYLSV